MKIYLLLFILFCFGCKNSNSRKVESELAKIKQMNSSVTSSGDLRTGNGIPKDTLKLIQDLTKQRFEANILAKSCRKIYASAIIGDTFHLKLELLLKGDQPIELFDPPSWSSSVFDQIIFLKSCLLRVYVPDPQDSNFYAYYDNHKVLVYFVSKGVISIPGIDADFRSSKQSDIDMESAMSRILSSNMAFFPQINYTELKSSPRADYTIWTIKKNPLRVKPDSNSQIIETLPPECNLVYLESGKHLDSIGNRKWIWYKVRTPNRKVGWIFGHPDFVEEVPDEEGA